MTAPPKNESSAEAINNEYYERVDQKPPEGTMEKKHDMSGWNMTLQMEVQLKPLQI